MSSSQISEKKKRRWAYALITAFWVLVTFVVIQQLSSKVEADVEQRRMGLRLKARIMEIEETLMAQYLATSRKIRTTQFQFYQMYKIDDLRVNVKEMGQIAADVAQQARHAMAISNLLINAQQMHVTRVRNLEEFSDLVKQCKEGSQLLQQ
ncbi:MAG: hypothetical protein RLZZ165_1142 [Bacteroidota bacterium]